MQQRPPHPREVFAPGGMMPEGMPPVPPVPPPDDLPGDALPPFFPGDRSVKVKFSNRQWAFATMRSQGRLLGLLSQSDGLFIKDIVEAFDIRPSSASELVSKLEKNGFVRVESDTEDKRARKVFLTDEGKALADKMKETRTEITNELFDGLTEEEQGQLLALLKKMNGSLADKSFDLHKDADKEFRGPGRRGFDGWNDRHEAVHKHRHQSPHRRGSQAEGYRE